MFIFTASSNSWYFNTDLSRNNAQTRSLKSFADESKLCLCYNHEEANVPYTHIPIRGEYSTK